MPSSFGSAFRHAREAYDNGDKELLKAALRQLRAAMEPIDEYHGQHNKLLRSLVTHLIGKKDAPMLQTVVGTFPLGALELTTECSLAARENWQEGYTLLRPTGDPQGNPPLQGVTLEDAWNMKDPTAYVHAGSDTHRKQEVKHFLSEARAKGASWDALIDFLKVVDQATGQNLSADIDFGLDLEDEFGPKK